LDTHALTKKIANFLEVGNSYSSIASLSHTVVLHGEPEDFDLVDGATGKARWFCYEEAIEHIGHGRGLSATRLWDLASGRPVASAMQDGLVRFKEGVEQSVETNVSVFGNREKEKEKEKEREREKEKGKL
jgi:acyl-CoA thioesterase